MPRPQQGLIRVWPQVQGQGGEQGEGVRGGGPEDAQRSHDGEGRGKTAIRKNRSFQSKHSDA